MRSFEGVLAEKPTNIVALLGKVRSSVQPAWLELTCLRNIGPYSLCKAKLPSSSQIIPAGPPIKPFVRSRSSDWYRSLPLGNGSQGKSKSRVAEKPGSGAWLIVTIFTRGAELYDQNPSEWAAQLLLGLESINASKAGNQTDKERAQAFLIGTKYIEKAFNANQKSAAAANALCELFLRKNNLKRVSLHLRTRDHHFFNPHSGIKTGRANGAVC